MAVRRRLRLAVVLGTRPEAIKLAPVIQALRTDPRFTCRTLATGQHRELLDQSLRAFGLAPDENLNLMRAGQSLSAFVGSALTRLEEQFTRWKPEAVLVQGDTGTALAAGLAAFYLKIKVGHVEAGLRSFDRDHPFPEETNRCLISRLAQWHFAPTPGAAANLKAEGVSSASVFVTGNTVVDALRALVPGLGRPRQISNQVVVTAHRRENIGAPLEALCAAVNGLARRHPELEWVFPVHPNPAVRHRVQRQLKPIPSNVRLIAPMDYPLFLRFLSQARLAITDSGGVQEEASVFGVPIMIVRQTTERPEVLQAGGHLVQADRKALVAMAERLLRQPARQPGRVSPFGDGRASARIVQALAWAHGLEPSRPKPFKLPL